jgi:N-acetylhexosamine 1-kinase
MAIIADPPGFNRLKGRLLYRAIMVTATGITQCYTMRMTIQQARHIASLFDLHDPFDISDFPEKGNINRQTYLIVTGPSVHPKEYILQQLNPGVFTQPRSVMDAMIQCIEAQRKAASAGALCNDEEWETIHLIPTKEGKSYLELADGGGVQCWRMMARIEHTRSYKSLREISNPNLRLRVAEQAGKGLALFGTLTAGMDFSRIRCPLPGYRDTKLYFDQLLCVLEGNRTSAEAAAYLPVDPAMRQSTQPHFLIHIPIEGYRRRLDDPLLRTYIDLALQQQPFAMKLARGLSTGELKTVAVHGDTKLENFLFDINTGKVKALVDMDTIMAHTWLTDWGDMVRSLVNPAGEKEPDLKKVRIDLEVFESVARGFLHSARQAEAHEVALMVDAVQIMSLELGVRFLADYLRGDNYFTLRSSDPWDLNRTRAMVQFRLFEELRANAGLLERILRVFGS